LHFESRNCFGKIGGGASQFALVMRGLGLSVSLEAALQTTVRAAIGVGHQYHTPGSMQAHGFTDLIQNKLAGAIRTGRSEVTRASSELNVIRIYNADALKKLAEPVIEAVVKAGQNGRITNVPLARRVNVKNLFQYGLLVLADVQLPFYRRLEAARCYPLRGRDKILRTLLLRNSFQ